MLDLKKTSYSSMAHGRPETPESAMAKQGASTARKASLCPSGCALPRKALKVEGLQKTPSVPASGGNEGKIEPQKQ